MPYYTPPPGRDHERFTGEMPPGSPQRVRAETAIGLPYIVEQRGMRAETKLFAPLVAGLIIGISQGDYVTIQDRVTTLTESYDVGVVSYAVEDNLLVSVEGAGVFHPSSTPIETAVFGSAPLVRETTAEVAQPRNQLLTVEAAPIDEPQIVALPASSNPEETGPDPGTLEALLAERGGSDTIVIID